MNVDQIDLFKTCMTGGVGMIVIGLAEGAAIACWTLAVVYVAIGLLILIWGAIARHRMLSGIGPRGHASRYRVVCPKCGRSIPLLEGMPHAEVGGTVCDDCDRAFLFDRDSVIDELD